MSSEGREQDLMDWLTDDLAAARRANVDAHLRECAECRALLADLQSLSAGLARMGHTRTAQPAARHPARASIMGSRRRWAAAAMLLLSVPVVLFVLGRSEAQPGSGTEAEAAANGPPARQLEQVDDALRSGSNALLLGYLARSSSHVPVRLSAVSGSADGSARLPAAELVAAFEAEPELMVRLWLVVEIARSDDAASAEQVRRIVAEQGAGAPVELRAAVEEYLTPAPHPGAAP